MYSLVFFLTVTIAMVIGTEYYTECKQCRGEECDMEPTEPCPYGKTRDVCGRLSCMSGPGSRCGGRDNHLGKCGAGLTCLCGKCKGCSIDRLYSGVIECDNTSPICS